MNNIEIAFSFMLKANRGKKFKFDDIDKSFHSLCVGLLLMEVDNVAEDIVCAGILHDIINETDYGYEDLEKTFGKKIATIVQELSEDMSIAKWLDRKKEYVKRIRRIDDPQILNIVVADKYNYLMVLYNSVKDFNKIYKYSGGSSTENRYLYKELYNICLKAGCDEKLMNKYAKILDILFGNTEF